MRQQQKWPAGVPVEKGAQLFWKLDTIPAKLLQVFQCFTKHCFVHHQGTHKDMLVDTLTKGKGKLQLYINTNIHSGDNQESRHKKIVDLCYLGIFTFFCSRCCMFVFLCAISFYYIFSYFLHPSFFLPVSLVSVILHIYCNN